FRLLQFAPAAGATPASSDAIADHKQAGVLKLVNAFRVRGHENAQLDPLGRPHHPPVADLALEAHDLEEADLDRTFDTGSLAAPDRMTLRDIVSLCRNVYCGSIGTEYMHIVDTDKRRWLQQRLESQRGEYAVNDEERLRILKMLTAAEGLEKFLHTRYVGQKRFSLEGGDSLIPLLHEIMFHAGGQGVEEIVMGMAHRGRLNVLVNILGKSPAKLFAEFEGKAHDGESPSSGDVKYHLGFASDIKTPGGEVHMALAFNPSHLEIVDPVVVGSARARQVRRGDHTSDKVMPVLMHGDAAFAAQGVVMELFQMSETRGFAVGGTLHIVINNQIGFTISERLDARSTQYCTAVAKMVHAPIFHVNADDPEAVHHVMKIACDFRTQFKRDVVIDLVCYRRHGHNEADEPAATQPLMYKTIRQMETTRAKYAKQLEERGLIEKGQAERMMDEYRERLDEGKQVADVTPEPRRNEHAANWHSYDEDEVPDTIDTTISLDRARALSKRLTDIPKDFKLHARVAKIIESRRKMAAGELPMDWGYAETLAYASLAEDGTGLRLVGQDSGRGTFFHRHAVLHNQKDGATLMPLAHINPDVDVNVIDSLLSEEAVMGFEYGYATAAPETLVIWEGQFGDFANGAQVVIDQFLTSGEAKWGRLCGLVLFLPHGYEGQGPEHSSARLERFLQLCSSGNIQVCVPSTPAQMFHMLRRQMLRPIRKPLIVMTPKSLLRNKESTSKLELLENGSFREVIEDRRVEDGDTVERVVLCSGKVWYDLDEARQEKDDGKFALVRVEQLHPFPEDLLREKLALYPKASEIAWCQEEPKNQGAWYQIRHHLQHCTTDEQRLYYTGRQSSASPAVGSFAVHQQEQKALVEQALSQGEGDRS
ncbi:MAG: 2-oxoglutarate dehydrogenase E1 component, partial [Xanthomonadales bacterium]|nr:2-oxoglutarate dehydrogenase E1 component [Xanthomonadales bacterium]